jgi:PAT family beta-lactamase induction signal transducer AmpG
MSKVKVKQTNPAFWVPPAYFAMGLPFIAISLASVLMYESMGVSDSKIAFWTSLIMLPWTIKPLWSPILEMFKTKKHFVVATQLVTGITFGLVALSLPMEDYFTYSIALLAVVAFSGSTNDIATDGLYMDVLSSDKQAKYIGWQGASYNLAKILTSGAFVYLAGELEKSYGVLDAWMIVIGIYGVVMILLAIYHSWMLPSGNSATEVTSLKEGFAIKIAPLFFKAAKMEGGLGLSTSDVGLVYGGFVSAAFVLGYILAGYFIAWRVLKKSLMVLVASFNIPFAAYAFLAYTQPESLYVIGGAVVLEYLGYGFGFVGLILFMMQQVAPGKYKMAHYAFASGIMNLGFMLPSMLSGYFSDWLGYKTFFIWVLIASIPAFLAAYFIPFVKPDNKEVKST